MDHVPVWYRVYLEDSPICWFPPRELAEVCAAFKCVVDTTRRVVHLI